jgi:hypothetical protein
MGRGIAGDQTILASNGRGISLRYRPVQGAAKLPAVDLGLTNLY